MTTRERFLKVMNFEKPDGRLPMTEWAPWWDKTYQRWQNEGLEKGIEIGRLGDHFGLDALEIVYVWTMSGSCPRPAYHGAPIIIDEASYEAIRPHILTDSLIEEAVKQAVKLKEGHDRGDFAIRIWLDGFFWFPRSLFGIENHLYAFYDVPELMHRINTDLTDFNLRALEAVLSVITPDMIGFGEDMSYNHGPMLSHGAFQEFLAPYYKKLNTYIKKQGIKILVDSDGDVMPLIPWLLDVGVEGIYPLERQSGVDVAEIRRLYPDFLMLGGYDKLVMSKGEQAMRDEFERLLPVMKTGGFVPSVDHQTPPEVSLENYRIYLRLFEAYCIKAISI